MIKAFVIKGKCLINKKDFDQAEKEFREAKEIAERNFESIATRKMLDECLNEVERQREIHRREESARLFLNNEDSSIPMNLSNTLKKLNDEKQKLLFYIGGIDLLCQLINDGQRRATMEMKIFNFSFI